MDKRVKKRIRKFQIGRTSVLALLFLALSATLIYRLYVLQIVNGAYYREHFDVMTTKTRTLKSTRGNIYDRNGNVLAYNRLSYSLTLEDSGAYSTKRSHQLSLNGEAYQISKILNSHGDSLSNDFHVVLDDNENYTFDVSGTSLSRFKADVYGRKLVTDMTNEEANSSADDMITYLSREQFMIFRDKDPYTEEELEKAGLPETLSKQEILDIIYVRYQLFTTSYRKYVPVTIATAISDESVAALSERKDTLTGIDIVEDSIRVYDSPEAFASLIGYIGKASADDLAELQVENPRYNNTSIVGKSGIEKVFETTLQGSDGQETVYVNYLGRVLKVDDASRIEPVGGNNVYLTIDKNLQIAVYQILEQRIAGILEKVIINQDSFDMTGIEDTEDIMIPITDVYNAIFKNRVLDTAHFTAEDASSREEELQEIFEEKRDDVFDEIREQLTTSDPLAYEDLDKEMKEYESYIVNDLLMSRTGILNNAAIDKTDETFLAWTRDEEISLKEYLTYAISKNWIDVTAFASSETYLNSEEIYTELSEYIEEFLLTDDSFSKILYKYLIREGTVSGHLIIEAMYDQGIFQTDDGVYNAFEAGRVSDYDLVISKIHNLELTPAMLALDPCSGSAVVTDPESGEIYACVTYPGYDNNRLTNKMDVAYYNRLAADLSRPFYNKATQQKTAPGSTFKLITATAGLEEGVIDENTTFDCTGAFTLLETPLNCWWKQGHNTLNVVGGIEKSCNVFFSNVGYALGVDEDNDFSDTIALTKLQSYAKMYDMDKPSGIEVPEAEPEISDRYAIPSSIGQGTNNYTTTQLARYVTTLASSGTSYNLSLIDRVTDTDDNLVEDYTPSIESNLEVSEETWDLIHEGMRNVVISNPSFNDMPVEIAGKTGTAQESKSRPSHALFISYAPYEDPEVCVAVRIGNGYSSVNAQMVGKDIYQYYFHTIEVDAILTGVAMTDSISNERID